MKRRMKQKNYGILMFVGIAVIVLIPFAPCRADWSYISSDVWDGDTEGSDSDIDIFPNYRFLWSTSFDISYIDVYANSSGAYAHARCEADSTGEITAWDQADVTKTPCEGCTVVASSLYQESDEQNPDTLYADWEMDGNGFVVVHGFTNDDDIAAGDKVRSLAYAWSGLAVTGLYGVAGTGYAFGDLVQDSNGVAIVYLSGEAVEDSNDVDNDKEGYYYAEMYFSVDASDTETLNGITRFEPTAKVSAHTFSHMSLEISPGYSGQTVAYAYARFHGSSSVEVSW